jgi:RNA polymerase sigma-70 factor (ECF subfamily)
MGPGGLNEPAEISQLLSQAAAGDRVALGDLFARHQERLWRLVRLRLNRRLQGRIDETDVVQEAFVEASRKIAEYLANPLAPFFLWLRHLTLLKLAELHRRHLGTEARSADREVSIYAGALPEAASASIAAQLLGKLTSPSQAAMRVEKQMRVQEALDGMDAVDREVLVLRHLEQLSNVETAQVLELTPSGARARHVRALKRLRSIIDGTPGLSEA